MNLFGERDLPSLCLLFDNLTVDPYLKAGFRFRSIVEVEDGTV